MGETLAGNIPEFTVSEISQAVRQTLESRFGRVRVRGEVTELRAYTSGHTYFCLKDEGGKLRAVIWKSALARLALKPENGVEVIATGRLTSYGERSEYQLTVERLDYAGAGAMLARIEALRAKLLAEGLFDPARKQPLPSLPALVGVITSPQGAVLHDIRTTIERRFGRPILLWPVAVQGEGAAAQIAAAIAGMDRLPADGVPRPDVLIVARGGGSLEDLLAFSDEALVRAAAACRIPLISAVGHETDTTLIDYASDHRAPTPTAAAELAVPVRALLLADLDQKTARLHGGAWRATETARHRVAAAAALLPELPTLIDRNRQTLDDRAHRLSLALPNWLRQRRAALAESARHLPDATTLLRLARQRFTSLAPALDAAAALARERTTMRLARIGERLDGAARLPSRLEAARRHLEATTSRLEGASYQSVLARGFALVLDERHHPVTEAAKITANQRLSLRFADGEVTVRESARAEKRQTTLPL